MRVSPTCCGRGCLRCSHLVLVFQAKAAREAKERKDEFDRKALEISLSANSDEEKVRIMAELDRQKKVPCGSVLCVRFVLLLDLCCTLSSTCACY